MVDQFIDQMCKKYGVMRVLQGIEGLFTTQVWCSKQRQLN